MHIHLVVFSLEVWVAYSWLNAFLKKYEQHRPVDHRMMIGNGRDDCLPCLIFFAIPKTEAVSGWADVLTCFVLDSAAANPIRQQCHLQHFLSEYCCGCHWIVLLFLCWFWGQYQVSSFHHRSSEWAGPFWSYGVWMCLEAWAPRFSFSVSHCRLRRRNLIPRRKKLDAFCSAGEAGSSWGFKQRLMSTPEVCSVSIFGIRQCHITLPQIAG